MTEDDDTISLYQDYIRNCPPSQRPAKILTPFVESDTTTDSDSEDIQTTDSESDLFED